MFKKITIVGVGLIGGSIGLAVKKKKLAGEVIGVARRESSRKKALKFKAVDKATLDLAGAVKDADLVIIASPVGKIADLAHAALKFMKKGAILTDVGSTKRDIVRQVEKFANKKVHFVGAHPMAGSEKTGVENATPFIFERAPLIITKTKNTNKRALRRVRAFWGRLGCRTFVISPQKHDVDISLASYLPHVVSFALSSSGTKDSLKFAASSLKDMTRVSASSPELWKDILLSAGPSVLESIRVFSGQLKTLEKAIRQKDKEKVKEFLTKAKRMREKLCP
jgi:prephenate dehydrogenase